ncbi:MAG: hypothetical protein Wins2KO_08820 [Winogradskyella sp.]
MTKVYKLLLIDDDEIFLKLAKMRFKMKLSGKVTISTAMNASEISEQMEKSQFDMIFIDLNMPGITGWQVIEKYKDKLALPSCTAFICSSSIDPKDHLKAANMSGIIEKMISKPIDIDYIRTFID